MALVSQNKPFLGTSNGDACGFLAALPLAAGMFTAGSPVGRQTPGTRVPDFHAISEAVTYIRAVRSRYQSEPTRDASQRGCRDAHTGRISAWVVHPRWQSSLMPDFVTRRSALVCTATELRCGEMLWVGWGSAPHSFPPRLRAS